jgi:hypothetical protein
MSVTRPAAGRRRGVVAVRSAPDAPSGLGPVRAARLLRPHIEAMRRPHEGGTLLMGVRRHRTGDTGAVRR